LTPELLPQYDTNKNGKLDLQEWVNIQNDAAEAARKEFRRYDINGNDKLDPEELKGVRQSEQQEQKLRMQKPKETRPGSQGSPDPLAFHKPERRSPIRRVSSGWSPWRRDGARRSSCVHVPMRACETNTPQNVFNSSRQ
jgi:hypothetical protein